MRYNEARICNRLELIPSLLFKLHRHFAHAQEHLAEDRVGLGSVCRHLPCLGEDPHISLLEGLARVGVLDLWDEFLEEVETFIPIIVDLSRV